MQWTKPEFIEIPLGMEVTAYVNTDAAPRSRDQRSAVSVSGVGGQGTGVKDEGPPSSLIADR